MLTPIEMLRFRVEDARAALVAAQADCRSFVNPSGIYMWYTEEEHQVFNADRRAADASCYQAALTLVNLEAELSRMEAEAAWTARLEAIRANSEAACQALQEESKRFMVAATVTANNAINTLPPSVDGETRTRLVGLLRYRLLMSRREPAAVRTLVRGLPAVLCGTA